MVWIDIWGTNIIGKIHLAHLFHLKSAKSALKLTLINFQQIILGPFFIDASVNGATYLDLLEQYVFPAIKMYPGWKNVYFQQDGAPAHFHKSVREQLHLEFPSRWIGRGSPFEWPPRSCDLTSPDFFIWSYLKDRVYLNKPSDTLSTTRTNRYYTTYVKPPNFSYAI